MTTVSPSGDLQWQCLGIAAKSADLHLLNRGGLDIACNTDMTWRITAFTSVSPCLQQAIKTYFFKTQIKTKNLKTESRGVSRPILGSLVVSVIDQRPRGHGFESLAAGRCIAIMGQLLFAPWACAYSTLHPFGVGK